MKNKHIMVTGAGDLLVIISLITFVKRNLLFTLITIQKLVKLKIKTSNI